MDLRQLGLSRNKARYIIDISKNVTSDGFDLESQKYVSTDEVREVMLSLRGVGPWTTNYVLTMCLFVVLVGQIWSRMTILVFVTL